MIEAKIIADSESDGIRITTMQLCYPRFIHSELMTHRVFSRNASSSRAIPVNKVIQQVREAPATPIHWGANQPGMQAESELEGEDLDSAKSLWQEAALSAANFAESMMNLGLHKQVANRILEPFQHIHVIVTATEWDNFFDLRCHPDAQPEIRELATKMREAREQSTPAVRTWHLPYVDVGDVEQLLEELKSDNSLDMRQAAEIFIRALAPLSAARCARVSYLTHDGREPSKDEDLKLFERLVGSVPMHASPTEHQAFRADSDEFFKNFRGWLQFRQGLEEYED